MEASSIVLMERENGILARELGSYEIESGLEYAYKAYVENGIVNLFLTTNVDVEDDEYNEIFDEYNFEPLLKNGIEIEEIEGEYNPVWLIKIQFKEKHEEMEKMLNYILKYHQDEIKRILENLRK